jgi:DNA polymerase III epsilon subunit-like protein
MTKLDNWPRVIQLAWLLCDVDGEELSSGNFLIRPDGWTIPDGTDGKDASFWIEHGFDNQKSLEKGIDIAEAVAAFMIDLGQTTYLVSHNMDFDYNVLGAECLRLGFSSKNRPIRLCTKELSTEYCRIPFPGQKRYPGRGPMKYKWPKLDELHHKLFGTKFEEAHDAMGDVRGLKYCFFELVKRKVIKLKTVADGPAID